MAGDLDQVMEIGTRYPLARVLDGREKAEVPGWRVASGGGPLKAFLIFEAAADGPTGPLRTFKAVPDGPLVVRNPGEVQATLRVVEADDPNDLALWVENQSVGNPVLLTIPAQSSITLNPKRSFLGLRVENNGPWEPCKLMPALSMNRGPSAISVAPTLVLTLYGE